MVKSVTIDLDAELHDVLQTKAACTSCSLSQLVNMAIREFMADDEDLIAAGEANSEPPIYCSEIVQELCIPIHLVAS
jgi:predicted transcriptional regulator